MIYNKHLTDRMQQRAIKQSTIEYVLYFGTVFHKAGALYYFLRDCDLPKNDRNNPDLAKLVGTTVVVSAIDHSVITVWKDRQNGLKNIKRKSKYNIEESEPTLEGKDIGWAV